MLENPYEAPLEQSHQAAGHAARSSLAIAFAMAAPLLFFASLALDRWAGSYLPYRRLASSEQFESYYARVTIAWAGYGLAAICTLAWAATRRVPLRVWPWMLLGIALLAELLSPKFSRLPSAPRFLIEHIATAGWLLTAAFGAAWLARCYYQRIPVGQPRSESKPQP